MKVLKFGGTSVGTAQSLRSVRRIVAGQTEPCVVTVSALGGITDCLLRTAALAEAEGDERQLQFEIESIGRRHHDVINAVVEPAQRDETLRAVGALIEEFATIIKAVRLLGELTKRTEDLIVSYGERMSCLIVTAMIPGAVLAHSLDFIRTRVNYGRDVLDSARTSELIARQFASLKNARVVIVPGFIARNEQGRISNLGRGGSDYTAAILAAELGAGVLEIWTDVDGFMSADPRKVGDARIIGRLSFAEAMELCNFGAKVVYPPTIYPVFNKNIPIIIKNTFNPEAPGTLIAESRGDNAGRDGEFLGVSAIDGTCLIELAGGDADTYERMVNALTRNGIETLLPDGKRFCGVRAANSARALEILNDKFAQELIGGRIGGFKQTCELSMFALVGRGENASADTAARVAATLNLSGIPSVYGPMQASPGTIAGMIPRTCLDQALKILHASFIKTN